ncbi:MAG: hypothetical protein HUU47_09560 [Bacteroidetes bacterium]|nr:hypothetical protein [Bacteroidota bacterium]
MSRINCPNCNNHSYRIALNNDFGVKKHFVGKLLLKLGYFPSFIKNLPIKCNVCSYSWKA